MKTSIFSFHCKHKEQGNACLRWRGQKRVRSSHAINTSEGLHLDISICNTTSMLICGQFRCDIRHGSVFCLSLFSLFLSFFFVSRLNQRYACVNLSCFVLSILQSPGFRPRWKHYNWFTALSGFTLCLAIMLVVSWKVSPVVHQPRPVRSGGLVVYPRILPGVDFGARIPRCLDCECTPGTQNSSGVVAWVDEI